jgi:peroxiredoxin
MNSSRWIALGLCLCLVTAGGVSTAAAAPPGEQLIDKVTQAYRDIDQYDATLRLTISQSRGRWTNSQVGDIFIALDRPGNRLLVDTPDQRLVADGQKLFYRFSNIPGKHLEAAAVSPLTCEWIIQQAPPMAFPTTPADLAFLLATDPLSFVSDGAAGAPATLPPDPADPLNRPRIEIALQAGTMTLTIDPATQLIDKVFVDVDTAAMNVPFGATMSYTFDIDVHSTDQTIADDRFAFDTTGSIASPSMQHMMASGSNAPHPLTGQPAPPLNLPDIDGNDHDIAVDDANAEVIVLDFWATWCPPCVAALPGLQKVYDWAQTEGQPVAIYAVNQGETVEEVRQFWEDKGLSIPVLMDENFTAAASYQVSGIPQTVIIADGKVRHVHVGYAPGMEDQIKAEVEALLAE